MATDRSVRQGQPAEARLAAKNNRCYRLLVPQDLRRTAAAETGARDVPPDLHRDRSGAKENRTPDLFHAMEALYQLSYSPGGEITLHARRGGRETRSASMR